jgi:flagellar L-ring protein FlgH
MKDRHPIRGLVVTLALASLLAGCVTTPETRIQRPLTAIPQTKPTVAENNGAIFQPKQGVALFEDRRARHVGDILTVNLVEKTSINRKSETTDERSASAALSLPQIRAGAATPTTLSWDPSSSNKQEFKDNETNSNTVTGTISVTVVDVLANGNLVVAGEKQLVVNNDTEFIRIAGVANPAYVTASNTINSTQLADVQIESKNSQGLDKTAFSGIMSRFFLTLLPF